MVALPGPKTITAIYEHYVSENKKEARRGYLGASQIGKECYRALWYSFRFAKRVEFGGRILRLFNTGHREEERLISDLRAIGCEVFDIDPNTGEQFRFDFANGHGSGGLDGVVSGLLESPKTPHLLECKTANKKSYNQVEKHGLLKAKPEHFDQMQMLMGLAKLKRGLYLVQCKDDDRLYMERVKYDSKVFKERKAKALRIINAETPLERLSAKPDFWQCKFCDFASICHGEDIADANCRTCAHSTPVDGGDWTCTLSGCKLNELPDCRDHLYIPAVLHWAEPIDGASDWVLYRSNHGGEFVNAAAGAFPAVEAPVYSSLELQNCTQKAVTNDQVNAAREILGGEVVRDG